MRIRKTLQGNESGGRTVSAVNGAHGERFLVQPVRMAESWKEAWDLLG